MDGTMEVRVRDTRRANWFWVENVLIDVFQPIIGPFGVGVYNALSREAGRAKPLRPAVTKDQTDLTLRELGALSGVSKDTAARMLWKMCVLKMVREVKVGKVVVYELLDLQYAAEPGIHQLRKRLQAAETERTGKPPAAPKVTVAEDTTGMLLFDQEAEPDRTAVSVGDKESDDDGRTDGKSPSQKEGGLVSNIDVPVSDSGVFVSHSDALSILERRRDETEDSHLNPPASGRTFERFTEVVRRLRELKPERGDTVDLRDMTAALLRDMGFSVALNHRIADRGDGRAGLVDLSAWDSRTSGLRLCIEVNGAVAHERSLMKLRALGGVYRVILLRTALQDVTFPGIHAAIAMGWPGNGAAERAESADAAAALQRGRTRVGLADLLLSERDRLPRAPVSQGPAIPDAATVRSVLRAVREDISVYSESVAEWDAAFAGVEYGGHELLGEPGDGPLLVLTSLDPPATLRGLEQFGYRINLELTRVFGGQVAVQVRGIDLEGEEGGSG